MRDSGRLAAIGLSILAGLSMVACGGGGGGGTCTSNCPVNRSTPTVTVTAANSSGVSITQAVTVTVTVSGSNGTPTGSVTLTSGAYSSAATTLVSGSAQISIPAGTLAVGTDTLTANYSPDASSSANYYSASGTGQVTITKATPTVAVTPASSSVLGPQSLSVTVTVSGGTGAPAATGTVVLASGSYSSAAVTLVSGSAQISIPAGSLAAGNDTLTATYTPDTAGAGTYTSATGTNSVSVSLVTPTVTVTPGSSSIVANQPLAVTVAVSWGTGNAAATGTVTLSGGGYTSAATTLTNGGATINIAANKLAVGADTLTVSYAPDSAGALMYTSASGTGSVTVTAIPYTLTVNSIYPSSGVSITANLADNNSLTGGTTPFSLTYNSGTQVTLTAVNGAYSFVSWSGCNSTSGSTCTVTLGGNTTVTATYNYWTINSITVSPSTATIGSQQQFTATVNGTGNFSSAVTWTVSAPTGSTLSPGTISTGGLYNTPYPAPATVTVTATSVPSPSVSGSVVVTLSPPSAAAGPALTVDLNTSSTPSENPHAISPYIYGVNGYLLDSVSEGIANPSLIRWGGDATSRYNYQNNWTNSASDWYFENFQNEGGMFPNAGSSATFTQFFQGVDNVGAAALGTVPVLGWVSNGANACSFPKTAFPNQVGQNGYAAFNSYNGQQCGYGAYANGYGGCTSSTGCSIYGSNTIAQTTSVQETPPDITNASVSPTSSTVPNPGSVTNAWADATWSGGWVNSIVTGYGNGASGKGVAIWDLDNEPTWWDAVHRDVHPDAFTYDEVTNNGIGTALAIKSADPTALVAGPVIDWWMAYFYSKKDIENGWNSGPCYKPWSGPIDRTAHGGVPLIEYYLQQFAKYSGSGYYNTRLLDYVDIHGYFAPQWPPNNANGATLGLTTAGDTQEQIARMNGTRVFWDPTYTDPDTGNQPFLQPNYVTDSNYTTSCTPPAQAPQLIPMLQRWVANDYPGTKTAIDEYNFGGLESINGAVVQADILGIFGRQGLDMGAFWPSTNYNTQGPGNYAFAMYRNYDLASDGAVFGDVYLYAISALSGADAESQIAVYAAQRSSDNAITIMVINKTYGPLTSTINLENFAASSGTSAQVYQYSNANLNTILQPGAVSVAPPTGGGTTSTISSYNFPGQSITLFVIPD